MPGHPAVRVGAKHKKKFEGWLGSIFTGAKAENTDHLARQVVLIMDGAFSTMLVHRDASYIETVGDAAAALVMTALPKERQ